MKRVISILLIAMGMSQAFADGTANIKIKISGENSHNTYFLCMPDVGCLSIRAASNGKVFAMMRNIEMNTLFVTNSHTLRVYNQGLPKSCDTTVKPNQTITIYGNLQGQTNDHVKVNNLHCVIS